MVSSGAEEKGGLRRQMAFYVVFQAVIFATMAVEISLFIRGDRVTGVLRNLAADYSVPEALVLDPVHLVLAKVALMVGVLLLTVALVMTLFIKRITIPLVDTIRSAKRIADGDLSTTVTVHFNDELGQLASSINDLSANYQEVLLLAQDFAARALSSLPEEIGQANEHGSSSGETRKTLEELEELLADFSSTFYRSGVRS